MQLIRTDNFSVKYCSRSVITVGNFDGVHRGHQEIFRRLSSCADSSSATSIVITFDPHPLQVISPDNAPLPITTVFQRRQLIDQSDIDILVEIPFSDSFSKISAEFFLTRILIESFGLKRLVVGHDYFFGRNREGNESFLRRYASEYGFELDVLEPVSDGNLVFSSSAVRRLVLAGDVYSASAILGRFHRVSGVVIHGREIGRAIGFPTANLLTDNLLVPADGVYAVWVQHAEEQYMGACSIGDNPTFAGGGRTIEVLLLDFNGNLYGKNLTLHFVNRLRELVKFDDVNTLCAQISADLLKTRQILSSGLPVRIEK